MGLTVKRIARINSGRHGDGHGLYLQVTPAGVKSWVLRYERDGRERWMGLGPVHTINLEEARERARKARQQLLDGIDPLAARAAAKEAATLAAARSMTFEAAAQTYFEAHQKGWRNAKHRDQFLSSLSAYAFPHIGALAVSAIDTSLVLRCLNPIWKDKTETASRVRGRIEAVLGWATVNGYRTGDNPARWRGHLSEALPSRERIQKIQHHAALAFVDLPKFMAALAGRVGTAARALEFTILTAARTGEVIGARWEEIDLGAKVWTVPAGRIKGGREHRVPLSDRALDILRSLPNENGNPFTFIGPRKDGISSMAMAQLLKRMNQTVTVHGFRSTFRDWAAEKTTYMNHVVEMALAHTVGSKVEAAYRRGDLFDQRRQLMTDWSRYCLTPPATKGEVVSLRKRK